VIAPNRRISGPRTILTLKRMNKHFAATAAGLVALAITVSSMEASGDLARAEALFNRTEYDRARQELAADTASLSGSSFGEAMLLFARLERDFAKAGTFYRRAMASENERAARNARLELAAMQYAAGDYRSALELLAAARGRGSDRDGYATLYFKGLCRRQLGDNSRAAAEFEQITKGEYASWSVLGRAEIDAEAGRLAEAVKKYEGLGNSRPSPIASFKLGECYETLGEPDKALDCYRSLVERFPRSLEAAKGNEKIQLLMQSKAKPKEPRQVGGGESGEPRSSGAQTDLPAGRGFTIQFGAFSTRDNALAVSGKLEKILRGVRVESVEMEGRIWHRVRAGFYDTREEAEKESARAKDRLGLAGTIVPLK